MLRLSYNAYIDGMLSRTPVHLMPWRLIAAFVIQYESDEQHCSFLYYPNGCRTFLAVALCQLLQHSIAVDKEPRFETSCTHWIRSCSIAHQIYVVKCTPVPPAGKGQISIYSYFTPVGNIAAIHSCCTVNTEQVQSQISPKL